MRVYMRTAQTGLIWSRLANSELIRAKRVGERSFSLVLMCLMKLDGSNAETSKNASPHANGSNRAHLELFWSPLG